MEVHHHVRLARLPLNSPDAASHPYDFLKNDLSIRLHRSLRLSYGTQLNIPSFVEEMAERVVVDADRQQARQTR
jgi:hypothetical protein